jgi:hypothetical protein
MIFIIMKPAFGARQIFFGASALEMLHNPSIQTKELCVKNLEFSGLRSLKNKEL